MPKQGSDAAANEVGPRGGGTPTSPGPPHERPPKREKEGPRHLDCAKMAVVKV